MQWRVVAKLLWAFDLSEPIDEVTGERIPLDVDAYSTGIVHAPLPFKATIKPRSQAHIDIINQEAEEALEVLKAWE